VRSVTRPKPILVARLTTVALAIALVLALTAASTAARTRLCPNFSVPRTYTPTVEVTFSFSKVRVIDVRCRKTRELITLYLFGKGHPAGPNPAYGSIIDGWNVLVLAGTASGSNGRARFSAVYR
jgi:hypothetical protein